MKLSLIAGFILKKPASIIFFNFVGHRDFVVPIAVIISSGQVHEVSSSVVGVNTSSQ
jgi:hypothetical protein